MVRTVHESFSNSIYIYINDNESLKAVLDWIRTNTYNARCVTGVIVFGYSDFHALYREKKAVAGRESGTG